MTEPRSALDDHEFMDTLLNLVVPPSAGGNTPGAGTMGLSQFVAKALQVDTMLGPLVIAGVEAMREAAFAAHPEGLAGMTAEAGTMLVATHASMHPFLVVGLMRHLLPLYYQHPEVLKGMGDPPRPPFPKGFVVEATDPALMAKLEAGRKFS